MKLQLKRKINKPFVFLMMISIAFLFSISILGYIYHLFPKLSDFNIIKVEEKNGKLFLYTTKSYNAISYTLEAYDKHGNIIFDTISKNEKIDISNFLMDYNDTVTFSVYAKNRKNEILLANNKLNYTNKFASFSKMKDHFINKEEDISLEIIGNNENETYEVEVFYNENKISDAKVKENKAVIKYESIKDCNGKITAKLKNKKNRILSLLNLYLNAQEVENFSIVNKEEYTTIWDDVNIFYTGGNNATDLIIKVYNQKNKLVNFKQMPFQDEKVTLPATFFKENESYKIELTAMYKDYSEIAKSDSIIIHVLDKQTVNPVYVNKNYTFIKKGTMVTLTSDTKDATIYYTTDGSNPTKESTVYKEPIVINEDMKLKTYATRTNMNDSDINTYDFKVGEKQLVVYLSPSNQYMNKGVAKAGYSNERDMMNKLTDYLEKELKNAGVTVFRNQSTGDINGWLAQSNSKKSDLHLAIHSNASIDHNAKGIEIYVDKSTSKSLSIASNIYHNLYEIYPYKEPITDRGVKYALGSLGEVNDSFLKCGTLIEIAYHDNYDDALWITQNMEEIAKNIANSILTFYQVNN